MGGSQQEISDFFGEWSRNLGSSFGDILLSALVSILIVVIGRWLARFLTKLLVKALQRGNVDATLQNFFSQLAYYSLLVLVIVIALANLGMPTNSLVAVIGASTLAIGFALQDSLSNIASGILVIMLRPFAVGDFVELGGERGVVTNVGFFHTEMRTPENKAFLIPNSDVMDGNIINFSQMEWIRVDMTFGIGYDDDLQHAKKILHEIVAGDERITDNPAPVIAVEELGDNSVNLAVRPFVKLDDMANVRFAITEQVKLRFDAAGISFPFPQRDIHLTGGYLPQNGSNS